MVKKIRNDSIFTKPIIKAARTKKIPKIISEESTKKYKNFFIFSLTCFMLIFSFFSLPSITKFFDNNFAYNKTVINVSKKNFELALNNKNSIIERY